jgi:hypothetical protein
MKELEVKSMLEDSRIPYQYKCCGRLSSEFLDGVDYAEQRIMEKGVEMWLACDGDGDLYVYACKPYRIQAFGNWGWKSPYVGDSMRLKSELFPEVTFENSPVKARIVILEDE